MEYKYDIFISYSRKDMAVADRICNAFRQHGITYFIDRQGIAGGMEFPALLAKAIKESRIFLFLASENSYASKFTQSEIIYAFNKKQKDEIIPYIIDGSTLPEELEFTFSAINWRNMEQHPIETILVDDILLKLGRQRGAEHAQSDSADYEEVFFASAEVLKKKSESQNPLSSRFKNLKYSGPQYTLFSTLILLVVCILYWLFTDNKDSSLDDFMVVVFYITIFVSIIGLIKPAFVLSPNRKDVAIYGLLAVFVSFVGLCFVVHDDETPESDSTDDVTIEAYDY